MGDWSLIARYLKEEASQNDMDQLHILVYKYPNLREELEILGRMMNNATISTTDTFNADKAFERVNERFKRENLIK